MQGRTVLASLACVHAACATPVFDLDVTLSPIAIGGRARANVKSGSCDGEECSYGPVSITSLSLDPPGVFELASEADAGEVTFRAVSEGLSTLHLAAKADGDAKSFVHTLAALPVDSISVLPRRGSVSCDLPALYATGMSVMLPIEVRHAGTVLHGEGFAALQADSGAIDPEASSASALALTLPQTPGFVTLTASEDPSLSYVVEVVSPQAIDGVVLSPADSHIFPIDRTEVVIDLFAGDRTVCGDDLTRTVVNETPAICKLETADGSTTSISTAGLHSVHVTGVTPGLCKLRVSVGATSLTATASIDVTM